MDLMTKVLAFSAFHGLIEMCVNPVQALLVHPHVKKWHPEQQLESRKHTTRSVYSFTLEGLPYLIIIQIINMLSFVELFIFFKKRTSLTTLKFDLLGTGILIF